MARDERERERMRARAVALLQELGYGGRKFYVPRRPPRDRDVERRVRRVLHRMSAEYETTGRDFHGPGRRPRRGHLLRTAEVVRMEGCGEKKARLVRAEAQRRWNAWLAGERRRLEDLLASLRRLPEAGVILVYRRVRAAVRTGGDAEGCLDRPPELPGLDPVSGRSILRAARESVEALHGTPRRGVSSRGGTAAGEAVDPLAV